MDALAIIDLIAKGLVVAQTLEEVGQKAGPAIKVLIDLAAGVKNGSVTDEQLAAAEATLDGLISDFNQPLT